MSYEKGDKFVLEIAEAFESEGKKLYRMKNFASLVFDENGIQKLRRIRETNEEQIAKARADGAEEAWSFRTKALFDEKSDEFKWRGTEEKLFSKSTYAEMKAAFEKWKDAQKWEPKVGDVVMRGQFIGVVSALPNEGEVDVWWDSGAGGWEYIENLTPTGKHIDLTPLFNALEG